MAIRVELDVMLVRRKMGVGEFAQAVGTSPANVAVLENGRAKAIRFSTLIAGRASHPRRARRSPALDPGRPGA